jgi:serine/threonine protein phosphatase 1
VQKRIANLLGSQMFRRLLRGDSARPVWSGLSGIGAGGNGAYPQLLSDQDVLVIGDIHGRLDLLEKMTQEIDARYSDCEQFVEVYLGDYVDRGPHSAQVIAFLLERARRGNVVCLAGNHEEMFLAALEGHPLRSWLRYGGKETVYSYGLQPSELLKLSPDMATAALKDAVPETHQEFLRNLMLWHQDGDYIFVHAGLRPKVPLEQQVTQDLLWIRKPFLNHSGDFDGMVVHGHTTVLEPEFRPNRINIDTGAYITGRLTCLRINRSGCSVAF